MSGKILESIYKVFFKRSTVYIPVVFVGAYFANEGFDKGLESVWDSRNQGKLFKHMATAPASDE